MQTHQELDEIDELIKRMQYLYAWLLEDFVYLIKQKRPVKKKGRSIWMDLYKKARTENNRIVESRSSLALMELLGAYKVLRYAVDKEFGFSDTEIESRDRERINFIEQNY